MTEHDLETRGIAIAAQMLYEVHNMEGFQLLREEVRKRTETTKQAESGQAVMREHEDKRMFCVDCLADIPMTSPPYSCSKWRKCPGPAEIFKRWGASEQEIDLNPKVIEWRNRSHPFDCKAELNSEKETK